MQEIKVLDHGVVQLCEHMGSDLSVVRAARTSYNATWRAGEDAGSDAKLINYLWKNRHSTPFEAVTFTFYIEAPIFVVRQWHRHRTQSYNEQSARYTVLPETFYIPELDKIALQSTNNKQGRGDSEDFDLDIRKDIQEKLTSHSKQSFKTYNELLETGLAKELARSILPVNTYTKMCVTVNLLNLLKFLTLRCDSHAQYEIRVYAEAILELIRPIVPVTVAAWEEQK